MLALTLAEAVAQCQEAKIRWMDALEGVMVMRVITGFRDQFEELASDYCRRTGWTEPS